MAIHVTAGWTIGANARATTNLDFSTTVPGTPTVAQLEAGLQGFVDEYNGLNGMAEQFLPAVVLDSMEAYAFDLDAISPVPPAPPLYERTQLIAPVALSFTPVPGTYSGGDTTPPNVAFVVTYRTAAPGRSGRGRGYLPGPPADEVDDSGLVSATWRADARDRWDNCIQAFLTELGGAGATGYDHSVVSLTTGGINVVTSYSVDNSVDTQRRRLPRGV